MKNGITSITLGITSGLMSVIKLLIRIFVNQNANCVQPTHGGRGWRIGVCVSGVVILGVLKRI